MLREESSENLLPKTYVTWHFSADMRICNSPGGVGWCARNMAVAGGGGGTPACSPPFVAAAIAEGLTGGTGAPGNSSLAVALDAPSAVACSTGTPPSAGGEPMWW